jgi:hypothetical protein
MSTIKIDASYCMYSSVRGAQVFSIPKKVIIPNKSGPEKNPVPCRKEEQ